MAHNSILPISEYFIIIILFYDLKKVLLGRARCRDPVVTKLRALISITKSGLRHEKRFV